MAAPSEMETARLLLSLTRQAIRNALDTSNTLDQVLTAGVSVPTIKKWGQRYWDAPGVIDKSNLKAGYYNPDGSVKDYNDLNNNQQASIFIDGFRFVNGSVNRTALVPPAVDSTRTSTKDTADTETETDFGEPEAAEKRGGASSQSQGGGGRGPRP